MTNIISQEIDTHRQFSHTHETQSKRRHFNSYFLFTFSRSSIFSFHFAMTSKRVASVFDDCTVKRPRPSSSIQLDQNARMAFMYFYRNMLDIDPENLTTKDGRLVRTLMLSSRFLNSYFVDPTNEKFMAEIVIETAYIIRLKCEWMGAKFVLACLNPKYLSALIRLSSLVSIKIHMETWVSAYFLANKFRNWCKICKALKGLLSLMNVLRSSAMKLYCV